MEEGLKILGGCKGCLKNCQWNNLVAEPEKAKKTKDRPYGCNDGQLKIIKKG